MGIGRSLVTFFGPMKPTLAISTSFLVGLILAAGCGKRPPTPITSVDCEILESVLTDFITRDEYVAFPALRESKKIVVSDKIGGFAENAILGWISPELVADIRRRNPKGLRQSLGLYNLKNPNILVRDLTGVDLELGLSPVLAGTRGCVFPSLPGYSKDGQTACLLFGYGPSAHGSVGFYILRQQNRGWTIVERYATHLT